MTHESNNGSIKNRITESFLDQAPIYNDSQFKDPDIFRKQFQMSLPVKKKQEVWGKKSPELYHKKVFESKKGSSNGSALGKYKNSLLEEDSRVIH